MFENLSLRNVWEEDCKHNCQDQQSEHRRSISSKVLHDFSCALPSRSTAYCTGIERLCLNLDFSCQVLLEQTSYLSMESSSSFDVDDVHNFFKNVWAKDRAEGERLREESEWPLESEVETGIAPEDPAESSRKPRTTANSNALKVTCEILRLFVTEAIQRAGLLTDIEGLKQIDEGHLWRIVSQLMHDF